MTANLTAVAGVIYPGVERFLDVFLESLKGQTEQNFDLVIVNDGASDTLKDLFPPGTIWISLDRRLDIAGIRSVLIDYVKDRYSKLVFVDLDDFYSAGRVQESLRWLEEYDFIFNELSLVNSEGNLLYPAFLSSLQVEDEIYDFSQLENRNVVGLSNSAVNLKVLQKVSIPPGLVAVDWYLFSVLVLLGCRGKFVKNAVTYYRQHDSNTVGASRLLSKAKLESGIAVKTKQYQSLLEFCTSCENREVADRLVAKIGELQELKLLSHDERACADYIRKVNEHYGEIYNGWWSEIISVGGLKKYAE